MRIFGRRSHPRDAAVTPFFSAGPSPLVLGAGNGRGQVLPGPAYDAALTGFLAWYATDAPGEAFSKAVVQRWMAFLETEGLAAYRQPAALRGQAPGGRGGRQRSDGSTLAQGIARCHGIKRARVRAGNWLTRAQAEALLAAPDTAMLKGKRDRALLAVLIGCGLRRLEASALTIEHIQQRDGR